MTKPLDLEQFEGHTCGPWSSRFASIRIGVAEGTIAHMQSGNDARNGPMPQKMFEANKALITAAPSLLAEVKALRELLKALPDTCDGKEQRAFEDWAKSRDMDMSEHPLHYLFLDKETAVARNAWRAAIEYTHQALGDTNE